MTSSIPVPPDYIFQATLLTLLSLEQTDKFPTPTDRPRQGSYILAGIHAHGHAPWLTALLRKAPEDSLEGFRPPPWLLPSLTEGNATTSWKSASNALVVKTNFTLAFRPGSVIDGVVKPYQVGTMDSNSALCRSILVSIANLRVFHSAIHTGFDT